jgi:sulfate adenylyltransferase
MEISEREFCDLELIVDGSFSPLDGFLKQHDYDSVVTSSRLESGVLWPIPVTLFTIQCPDIGSTVQLTYLGDHVGDIQVESVFKPDIFFECMQVYGTTDDNHPGVSYLLAREGQYCIGGRVTGVKGGPRALHHDFQELRLNPEQIKDQTKDSKFVIGFQTRNPMHNSHIQLVLNAIKEIRRTEFDASVTALIHPVTGPTQPGDIDHWTRIKCYQAIQSTIENSKLAVIPLAMRMAGPREALWHAIIRRNYGCSHFIVGRDPAGPSTTRKDGKPFYGPYDAHAFVMSFPPEDLGITIIKSSELVYHSSGKFVPMNDLLAKEEVCTISGTELRRRLRSGEPIPAWFTQPSVAQILRDSMPQGRCIYFVGLSGAGKTTLARALCETLKERYPPNKVTLLDGDEVRKNISAGLGFSRADRSANVRRIGYVASLLVKTGGIVVCANIAPYAEDREWNRTMITATGGTYFEVYLNTPLDVCAQRDVKGLYAAKVSNMTGVSDPFEEPKNADLILDTSKVSVSDCLAKIINYV